ncbi:MAG: fibronectin type III domain-containing protein, partial [Gammaproteobacteria bacterium]
HAQPRNVTLVPDRGALRVSWDAPATGTANAYYVRWAKSSAPMTWINSAGAAGEQHFMTDFLVIGLANGTSYAVSVGALVSGAKTFISAAVSGTPADPDVSPPALGAPEVTPLAWSSHPSAVSLFVSGAPADAGYIARWRRKTPPGEWSHTNLTFLTGPRKQTAFFDSGLPAKTRMQVQQAAVSSAGVGPWSPSVETFSSGPPDAPKMVSLETGANLLRIKWTRPDFDGGVELGNRTPANAQYRARWRVKDADAGMAGAQPGAWLNGNAEAGVIIATNRLSVEQSFAITMLTGGSEHEVQIRMRNENLPADEIDGAWSAALSATPAAPIGGTPQQRMNAVLTALKIDTNESPPRTLLGASADNPVKATFSAAARTYAFAVAHQVSSVNITATPGFAGAAVRIDNLSDSVPAAMESPANNFALLGNDNRIEIVLTSADGATVTTYTLMVFRGGDIVKINVEGLNSNVKIALMPAFDPLIATYSASPPSGVARIYVWANLGAITGVIIRRVLPLPALSREDLGGGAARGRDYQLVAGANVFEITAQNGAVYTLRMRTNPPDAPRGLASMRGDGQLTLTWTLNDDMAISGYKVRWKAAGASGWADPPGADGASAGLADLPYIVSGLTNGTTYEVQIAAVNFAGRGAWSASHRNHPSARPDAPVSLMAQGGAGRLALAWAAPANDGRDAISGYAVRWAEGAGAISWVTPPGESGDATGSTDTNYVLRGLKSATTYEVQIAARNAAGRGAWSASKQGATVTFDLDVNQSGAVDDVDGMLIERYLAGARGAALLDALNAPASADAVDAKIIAAMAAGDFDVDDSAAVNGTDGMLLARYLLGVTGDSLRAGLTSTGLPAVVANITALQDELNVNAAAGVEWHDGVLIARHMFGLRGAALTAGLGSPPLLAADVAAHINAGAQDGALDVDDNGATEAADGIMIARYLQGVRGNALTAGQTTVASAVVIMNIQALLAAAQ